MEMGHRTKTKKLEDRLARITDGHRAKVNEMEMGHQAGSMELEHRLASITETLGSTELRITRLNDDHRVEIQKLEDQLSRAGQSLRSTNNGINNLIVAHQTTTKELEVQLAGVKRQRFHERCVRITDILKSVKSTQSTIAGLETAHQHTMANLTMQHNNEIGELEDQLASTVAFYQQEVIEAAGGHCITVSDLNLEIDSAKFVIERAYAVVSSLESELVTARATNTTLSKELTGCREAVEGLTAAARDEEAHSSRLHHTIACRDHEIGSYRILYMALARELSGEQAVTRTLQSQLLASQHTSQQLSGRVAGLESALDSLHQKHDDLDNTHKLLASQYSDLKAAHDLLSPDYNRLKKAHDSLVPTHTSLASRYDCLKKAHDALAPKHTRLEEAHALLASQKQELQADFDTLVTVHADNITTFNNLEAEHTDLGSRHTRLEEAHALLALQEKELQATHDRLVTQHDANVEQHNDGVRLSMLLLHSFWRVTLGVMQCFELDDNEEVTVYDVVCINRGNAKTQVDIDNLIEYAFEYVRGQREMQAATIDVLSKQLERTNKTIGVLSVRCEGLEASEHKLELEVKCLTDRLLATKQDILGLRELLVV